MPVTISEIARLAGVSHSTVSRVLNGAPIRVSPARREAILDIARRYNYVPNRSARALKTGRRGAIAVITYDITDAFAVECVAALEKRLAQTPCHALWMSCAHADESKTDPLKLLYEVAQTVDGILIIYADSYLKDSDILQFWATSYLPLVTVIRSIPADLISSVTIDDRLGATLITEHLLELGHKRIAFCYSKHPSPYVLARHQVYQEVMQEARLEVDGALQIAVDGTVTDGYQAGRVLINRPRRPSAIIGFNDLTAIGLMKACSDSGLRVPQDISIAGFDNIRMAELTNPALTSVATNFTDLAQFALDELFSQIESPRRPTPAHHFITSPKLIVRQSTAPLMTA